MAWVKNIGMKPAYVCDSCGFCYRDAKTALECEAYCRKNKSSNPEITGKAFSGP